LINDILDLSKVEAGRLELDLSQFNVAHVVNQLQTVVKTLAIKKRITLNIEIDPDLPLITADEAKFKQILFNLFSNAIKYTLEGGSATVLARVIDCGADSTDTEITEPCLEVSVTDTGIGIKAEDIERVFGTFEQLDSSYAVSRKEPAWDSH
jgi:signal transduction histidine kinase